MLISSKMPYILFYMIISSGIAGGSWAQDVRDLVGRSFTSEAALYCQSIQATRELYRQITEAARSPVPRGISGLPQGCGVYRSSYTVVRLERSFAVVNSWIDLLDDNGGRICRISFANGTSIDARCRAIRNQAAVAVVRGANGREMYTILESVRPIQDQYVARHGRVP